MMTCRSFASSFDRKDIVKWIASKLGTSEGFDFIIQKADSRLINLYLDVFPKFKVSDFAMLVTCKRNDNAILQRLIDNGASTKLPMTFSLITGDLQMYQLAMPTPCCHICTCRNSATAIQHGNIDLAKYILNSPLYEKELLSFAAITLEEYTVLQLISTMFNLNTAYNDNWYLQRIKHIVKQYHPYIVKNWSGPDQELFSSFFG
jgi:hypothetical protein